MDWIIEPISGFTSLDTRLMEASCSGDGTKLQSCTCTGGLVVCQCSGGLTQPEAKVEQG